MGNTIYSPLIFHDKYDFAIYKLEGRTVRSVEYPKVPKLEKDRHQVTVPFGRMLTASKHGILFTRTFDNTIYKVENDALIPFRTIDFGQYFLEEARTYDTQEISGLARRNIIYSITNARLMGEDRIVFNGYIPTEFSP